MEVTTTWGKPALKVHGRMFVCLASHKSAEPDTLVVMMDFPDRDVLIEDDPDTYYLKEHYVGYPCVLVRLSRVRPDALRDLVIGAHRYVSARRKRGRRVARAAGGRRSRLEGDGVRDERRSSGAIDQLAHLPIHSRETRTHPCLECTHADVEPGVVSVAEKHASCPAWIAQRDCTNEH